MSVHDFWTPFAAEPFINALIIGLSLASIWLVAALGLTIIYGTMGVINMAHGEFIMLGAYFTWILQYFGGFPWLLCLPISFFQWLSSAGWSNAGSYAISMTDHWIRSSPPGASRWSSSRASG